MKNILPQHIAIIMDGNGRWAKKRHLPRISGHIKGVATLKKIIKHCGKIGIKHLSVFAFSRENWQRPEQEVSFLMKLLHKKLKSEVVQLHANNVVLKFVGDKTHLSIDLQQIITKATEQTSQNNGLHLNIYLDYSGQYDITQAVNQIIAAKLDEPIDEQRFAQYLLNANTPNPDLLIRTGNEIRVSNFMLWQIAYSELYFSATFWPEFSVQELDQAIAWYMNCERRLGKTSEQLAQGST